MFNRIAIALLLFLLLWGGLFSDVALSQRIESRLDNLESDFSRLQSQLNRIESGCNNNCPPTSTPAIPPPSTSRTRTLSPQQRDKMFDRLATLVVELKQDVRELQKRLSKLESGI